MTLRRLVLVTLATSQGFFCTSTHEFEGVSGGIGHYPCAVMLSLDLEIVDERDHPVADAEVWEIIHTQLSSPPPDRARRLGSSDETGRFKSLFCLMDTREFEDWHPPEEPVEIDLMVFREGVGAAKVSHRPDTMQILDEGNNVGVTPDEYRLRVRAPKDAQRYKRRAPVFLKVVL
jgi:hypothetical protein